MFRIKGRKGKFIKDILGLEKEKIKGIPLLIKVVNKGKIIYKAPSLYNLRMSVRNNLFRFKPSLKDIYTKYKYPVVTSSELEKLRCGLVEQLKNMQ